MKTVLQGITSNAGFLQGCSLTFSEGLNCIIGPPGTCKSVIIETIRFAFDIDIERVAILEGRDTEIILKDRPDCRPFIGKVAETLGAGSVRCSIKDIADDTIYDIEREIGTEPRTYRAGVKDHSDTRTLRRIEIYSQGDLQRIAGDETLALSLIDQPHLDRIEPLRESRAEIVRDLRVTGHKIRDLRSDIQQLKTHTQILPSLRAELSNISSGRPKVSSELDSLHLNYTRHQQALRTAKECIKVIQLATETLRRGTQYSDRLFELTSQLDAQQVLEAVGTSAQLRGAHAIIQKSLQSLDTIDELRLDENLSELERTFSKIDESYHLLRQQEQAANEFLKTENELKNQIDYLERYQIQLDHKQRELNSISSDRRALRTRLADINDRVFEIRSEQIDAINQRHSNLIVLTLEPGGLTQRYRIGVEQLLQGSRLREQPDIARDIAKEFRPAELIDLVEANDIAGFALSLNRDPGQVTRLVSYLLDCPELYDLEGEVFEDRLNIIMFHDGEQKPIQSLSKGQKAMALLPLILRSASYPLIFDQPEDDLDNRFISNTLVPAIADLKKERQIIFVTHNANIPVIGDAEQVIVMKMDTPHHAAPPVSGTVDQRQMEIVDLLEGGAEAFCERQRHYLKLLDTRNLPHA